MADFHFLRPEYLFAFIPVVIFLAFQIRQSRLSGQWNHIVAPQLREFVIKQSGNQGDTSWLKVVLGLCTALVILASAGPSWEKQESQIYNSRSGIIVALDLSLSMTAQDVTPSRLQRAKYKITDILNKEDTRNIGLIAYAADTHIASPLTRDADTLKALLPALDPFIMPGNGGSNTLRLAEEAVNLFEQSKSEPRTLILVTDGVENQDIEKAAALLKQNKIQLSVLAIGTEQGAPMLQPDGRFFKGADGQPIMPPLEWDNLKTLSNEANGRIQKFSNTDSDIDYLLADTDNNEAFQQVDDVAVFDQWQDNGHWLMIPILLLALFAFRRGVILIAVIALFQPNESWAIPDILLNDDQVALKQFDNTPEQAAQLFNDPNWKASSLYRAGKYEEALSIWQNNKDAQGWYNQGNAHAQLGQLDEAIYAYEQALAHQEDFEDAEFNKSLVEQMKQQQQEQDGQQGDNQQQNDQQDGQQSDQHQQQGKNQQQDGQSSDQQNQQSQQENPSEQNSQQQDANKTGEQDASENPMNQHSESEQSESEESAEQQAAQQQDSSPNQELSDEQKQMLKQQMTEKSQMTEKDQAVMQMIQKIPDDPSGLLRNKFYYQYQQRNRQQPSGDRKSW